MKQQKESINLDFSKLLGFEIVGRLPTGDAQAVVAQVFNKAGVSEGPPPGNVSGEHSSPKT